MIWKIILVIIFTTILAISGSLLFNLFFISYKKPWMWYISLFSINFLFFLAGSLVPNSLNVIWWSSFVTFLFFLPAKQNIKKKDKDFYEKLGITKIILKYRLGVLAFVIGGIIGWFLFYGETINQH